MNNYLVMVIIAIIVIFLLYNRESFSISRTNLPIRQLHQFNLPVHQRYFNQNKQFNLPAQQGYFNQHVNQNQQFNLAQQQRNIAQNVQSNLQGQNMYQGLSQGNALSTPGIVPGSAISNLQQQYVNIFSPYSPSQMSGQQQMQQHLFNGLGQSGWNYSMSGMPGYSYP